MERTVSQVDVRDPVAGTVDEDGSATRLGSDVSERLGSAQIWHVSSTATGGGVAELLRSSIGRHHLVGLPANWLVPVAEPAFFQLTKRIHHGLHGRLGDGGFSANDHELYRSVTAGFADGLLERVRAGDIVVLHDPQTLGAGGHLARAGARVAWRCHVGTSGGGASTAETWGLLEPHIDEVPLCIFTMPEFAPSYLAPGRTVVILPSIDPLAAKNRKLSRQHRDDLLASIGLIEPRPDGAVITNPDGSRLGFVVQDVLLPQLAPAVVQVSRWDPLKDMSGVLRGFAEHTSPTSGAHLLLAGPDPADIPDDPEGARVYTEVRQLREALPEVIRPRVHLAMLSLHDFELNGLVVNALQRRATVVVQKSLEEGFGLTAAEAMWKERPVIASRVGGLTAQIVDGVTGLLVDPLDLPGFGSTLTRLLDDPAYATRLGRAGRKRCAQKFLAGRELVNYLRLYLGMFDGD